MRPDLDMSKTPELTFVGEDHPEANGRTPLAGEVAFSLRFRLEDGRVLEVLIGMEGMTSFQAMVARMLAEDA